MMYFIDPSSNAPNVVSGAGLGVILMELMDYVHIISDPLTLLIQVTIGILTIIYLIKQIKKPSK